MIKSRMAKFTVLSLLLLGAIPGTGFADYTPTPTHTWHPTLAEAMQEIEDTGKTRILLLVGNPECYGCDNTKYWWSENTVLHPCPDGSEHSAQELVNEHYVTWYCDELNLAPDENGLIIGNEYKPFDVQMPAPRAGAGLPWCWVIDTETLTANGEMTALGNAQGEVYPNMLVDLLFPFIPEIPVDGDGDGLTDSQEIALGTDPADPGSVFVVDNATALPDTGKMRIEWASRSDVLYRVRTSPNLVDWSTARDWLSAQTPPLDGVDLDLGSSNSYFKVEADIQ